MKLVKALGFPLITKARREYALRDADTKSVALADVNKEVSAALNILSMDAKTPGSAVLDYVKGMIAGRPRFFDETPVSQWIKTARVEALVQSAVRGIIRGEAIQTQSDDAAAFYAEFPDADGPGQGYAAFEYAVAFAALYVARDLTVGDRLIMDAISGVRGQIAEATAASPHEVLDAYIANELDTMRRSRFFMGSDHKSRAERLARRVQTGDLGRASPAARATALAHCARYLARDDDGSPAEILLAAALAIEPGESTAIADAFIRGRTDVDDALARLVPVDTPAKRTAALLIVLNDSGHDDASAWADEAGITFDLLDSDGKHVLVSALLQAQRWEEAYTHALKLTDRDLEEAPAAKQALAVALIAHNVPDDLRVVVTQGTPFNAASFPMFDSAEAIRERKVAAELLERSVADAESLGCAPAARILDETALWLRLRDPATTAAARRRLEDRLSADDSIASIPMGIDFEVELDIAAIERGLSRATALSPKGDAQIALARLKLAGTQASPGDAADYFQRHREMMFAHLNASAVLELEIKLLVAAGRAGEAQLRFDAAIGIDDLGRARVQAAISTGTAGPTVADLETAYAANPATANLAQLVTAMALQGYSTDFVERARSLLKTTRARSDAEGIVHFLLRNERHDDVALILGDIPDLVGGSPLLRSALAWSAFRAGDIGQATTVLEALRAERDVADDRALAVHILIASGRWPDLSSHVEDEWTKRDARAPAELLATAQLAAQIRSSRVAGLIALAAEKAPADPEILLGCYVLSTNQGLEDVDEVHRWFAAAVRLSGEDGPVQTADIEELVNQMPDRHDRVSDTWRKLKAGELPRYVAARLLGRPSLDLLLSPMLANRQQTDPRRRSGVPAYSGVRARADATSRTVALDGSSLVILASLDLVGVVVAQRSVVIAHSTLGWLFGERQRLAFHQPSRIAVARRMSHAMASGRLQRFISSKPVDERFVDVVGRDLAAMLDWAVSTPENGTQRVVVRSAPVRRVGSFRGEGVDLSAYSKHLVSCLAVVDKLVEVGQLTIEEEDHARAYLSVNEERWPDEVAIADGAELFLDDLSVAYLNTTNMLDKLAAAGLKVFISEHQVEEMNALVAIVSQEQAIEAVIEHIRMSLAAGIASGAVKLASMVEDDELKAHPDMAVIELAGSVDAIVCDDRYINKHVSMEGGRGKSAISTSLDLLGELRDEGAITTDDHRRHLTALRRSGLLLIPTSTDELVGLVARTRLKDGRMGETGELRAFRENLATTQMFSWLRLPAEAGWLQRLSSALIETIVAQWTDTVADADARARSRWLLDRADMRNWSAMITEGDGTAMATYGLAIPINSLLTSRLQIEPGPRHRFDLWMRDDVVEPLRHAEPLVHAWLIDRVRQLIETIGFDGAVDDD